MGVFQLLACFEGNTLALTPADDGRSAPPPGQEDVGGGADSGGGDGDTGEEPEGPVVELFLPDQIPTFRLTFADADWARTLTDMIPADDCADRPFLPADLVFEDPATGVVDEWRTVGVRYRGHSALWIPNYSSNNRWGFKLSFDVFAPRREFHGNLDTLNLLGTEGDYSLAKEVLALELYREAGVPAPRGAWARLYVNDEYLGLFPYVEEPDDSEYLANRLGADGGSLYEVSGYCGNPDLTWYGDDPEIYSGFEPKAATTEEAKALDLVPLIACGSESSDEAFAACFPTHADVPAWLDLMAMDALLANYDGLPGAGHNYLMWFPPDGAPALVWPYDLDLALYDDAWTIASTNIFDFRPVWVPSAPELTRRMRRVWSGDYCAAILDFTELHAPDRIDARIEEIRALLAAEIEADPYIELDNWSRALEKMGEVARERSDDVRGQAERCDAPAGEWDPVP